VSNTRERHKEVQNFSNRVKLLLVLLCVGIAGIVMVFWFRHLTNEAVQQFADNPSFAHRGAVTNLTEIFQIPAFMFFGVLVAYSISELYKIYRAMNNPETYRNKAVHSAARSTARASTRGTKQSAQKSGRQSTKVSGSRTSGKPKRRPGISSARQAEQKQESKTEQSARRLTHQSPSELTRQVTDLSPGQSSSPSRSNRKRVERKRQTPLEPNK